MRRHRIRALAGRRFRPCTTDSRHYLPPISSGAPNLLAQRFVAAAPNRIWLADITYIATSEGWLYLAAVLDLATRKIVGWAMRDHMRTELPLAALMMAAQRQRPVPGHTCTSTARAPPDQAARWVTSRACGGKAIKVISYSQIDKPFEHTAQWTFYIRDE